MEKAEKKKSLRGNEGSLENKLGKTKRKKKVQGSKKIGKILEKNQLENKEISYKTNFSPFSKQMQIGKKK